LCSQQRTRHDGAFRFGEGVGLRRDRPVIGGIMLRAIRSAGNVAGWRLADGMDAVFSWDGD
jgi:hypothetical protein